MLEITDLEARYGHVRVLSRVSLSLSAGEIFAVLGANGAGKTTLLRSVLGLTRSTGSIRFAGERIDELAPHDRVRRGLALVPEGRRLFADFTVEENLRVGAINRRDASAVEADIEEIYTFFPVLKQRRRQGAGTLSGGEGQMLAIGRALVSRPKALLLDEPSVGLMPTAVAEIFTMLKEIAAAKGITVLVVEQNTHKALSIADTAAVLELGGLVLRGTAAEIAANPRVKEAYLGR